KAYPTFDVAAFIFGTVRSVTFEWKSKLLPVLERALGRVVTLPKRQIRSVEEFLQLFPEVKDVFIDGTEHPVQRPRKSKSLRRKYSGKKKRHTRKNTIFCDENSRILAVSPSKDGRIHDSRQVRKCSLIEHIPKEVALWMDKAYSRNIAKNGNAVMIPHKKPRKGALTDAQKDENKIISGIRIVVEHAIGGIKRFRCMTDPFRNKNGKDDQIIVVAAALWNLHLLCKS
ncbi:MAG: transposase family protein, partial [Holosporaceae bacterium]|nr:transposase family protein [Holosporaceae bacterium]